jgi:hypothetical protein
VVGGDDPYSQEESVQETLVDEPKPLSNIATDTFAYNNDKKEGTEGIWMQSE